MQAQAHEETAVRTIAFPSLEWFRELGALMKANRARQEHLGFIDCIARFTVLDGGIAGKPWSATVTFEEFEATEIREGRPRDDAYADFTLEATMATWRDMIENIALGHGRPDLTHTLNYMSHTGTPIRVWSDDPLRKDMFFRFNQSIQEFINASAAFRTVFDE